MRLEDLLLFPFEEVSPREEALVWEERDDVREEDLPEPLLLVDFGLEEPRELLDEDLDPVDFLFSFAID